MSFDTALAPFQDNLARIGGDAAAMTEPEKYNLYAGLMNLAAGLQQLRIEVQDLRTRLARPG